MGGQQDSTPSGSQAKVKVQGTVYRRGKKAKRIGAQENISCVKSSVREIYDTKLFWDVKIVVGEGNRVKKFQAHRCILGVRSQVLGTMIEERWLGRRGDERKITLNFPKATPEAFAAFLKYFYTDELDPSRCNLQTCLEIYELAHMYKMPRLQATAADIISKRHTNMISSHQIWSKVRFIDEKLGKKNWKVFTNGIVQAASKNRYLQWDFETIKLILSENLLPVREVDLFRALLKWGRYDEYLNDENNEENEDLMARYEGMMSLMQLIRFHTMRIEDFTNYVVASKVFSSEDISEMLKDFGDAKEKTENGGLGKDVADHRWIHSIIVNGKVEPTKIKTCIIN